MWIFCFSYIKNVSNNDKNSYSNIECDSDDYETKYVDGVGGKIDTKGELSSYRIQQMVCSVIIPYE